MTVFQDHFPHWNMRQNITGSAEVKSGLNRRIRVEGMNARKSRAAESIPPGCQPVSWIGGYRFIRFDFVRAAHKSSSALCD
jgi:hypothetical protein